MGLSMCWWALDWSRQVPSFWKTGDDKACRLVRVEVIDSRLQCGFSVEDREKFEAAWKQARSSNTETTRV